MIKPEFLKYPARQKNIQEVKSELKLLIAIFRTKDFLQFVKTVPMTPSILII